MYIKIKTWEQLTQEFIVDEYNDILCEHLFTTEMERLLPENRIIQVDAHPEWYDWYYCGHGNFLISEEIVDNLSYTIHGEVI
jgi:hypothetical protein